MSEEEIEYQLKKSRRQNKDERYEYINTHFNQTAYAMKLEKHALKIHREKHQLQQRIEKAIKLIEEIQNFPHTNINQHKDLREIKEALQGQ